MKIKVCKIRKALPFFLICAGLFFMPSAIRTGRLRTEWALINIVSWAGIALLTRRCYKNGILMVSSYGKNGVSNPLRFLLLAFLFLLECLILPELSFASLLKYMYATILPIFILHFTFDEDDVINYIKLFSNTLTIAATVVVICGLSDMFLGTNIGRNIAEFVNAESLIESIRQGRMVSYFGHPLLTAEIMILTFSFNTLINSCIEKKSVLFTVYYSLICVIGIGMCGGKTGLALIAAEFVLLYINRRGLKYFFIVAIAVYWAFSYGLLDTVIGRFIDGFASGDLTTGRNLALAIVLQGGSLKFNWVLGHAGTTLSVRMIAALEYPPLRWAYLFGIWFSIAICVILFVIPVINVLKNETTKVLVVLIILILDVNSYNGITTQSDQMLLYCVSTCLLMNLSHTLKKRGNVNEDMRSGAKPIYVGRYPASCNHHLK